MEPPSLCIECQKIKINENNINNDNINNNLIKKKKELSP